METDTNQLFAYMRDSKFYNYFEDLDSYFYPTKSETTKMIRLSQMAGNYKNDLFRNIAERPVVKEGVGKKKYGGPFNPEICSDLPYMTLIRILQIKSQHSENLTKRVRYGFIWGEDKKNCNKVVAMSDMTYYVDEIKEFEVCDIDDPKLLKKKTVYALYEEVKSLLN